MDENNINETIVNETKVEEQAPQQEIIQKEETQHAVAKKCCINTTSLCSYIAYFILLAGLIVLYIFHFTGNKDVDKLSNIISSSKNSIMLTVNNDSIIHYFTLADQLKKDLESEATKYQQELASKQNILQEKYKNYQINLQKNNLTQTQIQNAEKQLQQEAADLQGLQEQYSKILASKEESVHREITDSIVNAAQRVNNSKYKADYVLATSTGSAILYANKVYDITDEVIKELNDAYKKSSK